MSVEKTPSKSSLICILGSTHKTDVIIDFIPAWIKSNPKGEMIVFDAQRRIAHTHKNKIKCSIINNDNFKWVDWILKEYKDKRKIPKLLVLNGGDILFPKPKEHKIKEDDGEFQDYHPVCHSKFKYLLAIKYMLNMDIVITFPAPDSVPVILDMYVSNYIILPGISEYRLDRKSHNYFNLHKCIKAINYYHQKYGKYFKDEHLNIFVETNEIVADPSIDENKLNEAFENTKKSKKRIS